MKKTKSTIFLAFAAALLATAAVASAGKDNAKAAAFAADDTAQDTFSADSTAVTEEAPLPDNCVVDEVIWVVGDEPILKSEVEIMRLQGEAEGMTWRGDPDCSIPEQIAVQKLFLHQAEIDSIQVSEAEIAQGIDMQINRWIAQTGGSREKLEEYKKMTISQLRQSLHDDFKNSQLVQQMKQKLVEDITVTPADVRRYFRDMPEDSIPFVPTEVEVEIITKQPKVSQEEINRIKNELREYTDRVNKGETSFATLARLYSEDPGSARQGGEMDYIGRGMLDPAFAGVAFNLTDPKKISKIVESEYGFHIIQLIDKRGDKIKVRHILRTPKVSSEAIDSTKVRLDSLALDIRGGKYSFEEVVSYVSDDKDTRNNHGLMSFVSEDGRTSRFQMKDLPTEVARQVANMQVGEISPAFRMVNEKNKTVCAIVKLKSRTEAHRATINEDYQVLKKVVLEKERADFLHNWVVNKIKNTYVRMNDRYKDCDFEYQGWVK